MKLCAFADEASVNLDGQIKALKRNDMTLLEIRGVDGENIKDISSKKIIEIKKALDENGLGVWSIGSPIGKSDPTVNFDGQIDDLKHVIESAQILGAKKIRMFSFHTYDEKVVLNSLEKFLKVVPSDITLCHENEKNIYGDIIERCVKIHTTFPEIKAVFDPANFVQCGVDTKEAWKALNPYVEYMHIKDALKTGEVVPAGQGVGNLKYLLGEYKKLGGEVVTLEPHLMEFYGLSKLENGQSLNHAASFNDTDEAFDIGANALKSLLKELN